MGPRVCAFTDTYLPTINGVTYTVKTWREAWRDEGDRMDVVYPSAGGYEPDAGEHPVPSLPFPFYEGYRLGTPLLPQSLDGVDIVHAHTPFSLGIAAIQLVGQTGRPFVTSYHTPTQDYTPYLANVDPLANALASVSRAYQRWFFDHADVVIAPSETAATDLRSDVGIEKPVEIVSNGVDVETFQPRDTRAFRQRHDLPEGPIIGYTGRHGHEKQLPDLLKATAAGSDEWTVVLGGSGPATPELVSLAESLGVDGRFLGFLDREELPAFYSTIDVFAFPSPVETQGLVALEAMACGTPVVGVDAGALSETIDTDETGYLYPPGDIEGFARQLERALAENERLREHCLDRRERLSITNSVDALRDIYARVT